MADGSAGTPDVVVMGRVLVDFYPETDGPLSEARLYRSAIGGSPANVAVAAARLGLTTEFIGCVGDDPLGGFIRAEFARANVGHTGLRSLPGVLTPIAVCEIDPPDRFPLTFYRPAPAADLQIELTDTSAALVSRARLVWASLSGMSGTPARDAVLDAFGTSGSRVTVLDLDYRPTFWRSDDDVREAARDALPSAAVAIGNLEECRIALGLDEHATEQDAADALLASGVQLAIVKLGERGVFGATATERRHVRPIPVNVVNGLGAGDAFGGALCAALLDGLPLTAMLRLGNAAGALVASRRGASEAMPTRAEVDAWSVADSV